MGLLIVGAPGGVAAVRDAPPAEARVGGGGGGRAFVGGGFHDFRGDFMGGGGFRRDGFGRGGGGARSLHPMASHFGGGGFGFPGSATRRFAAPIDQAPDSARFVGRPAPQGGLGDRTRIVAGEQDGRSREFHHGQFPSWLFRQDIVGWAGPEFWPYAYDQRFDALSEAQANQFWAYDSGDLFGGMLFPGVSPSPSADYGATADDGLDVAAASATTPPPPAIGAESSPAQAAEASAAKDLAASCETQKNRPCQ